VLGQLTGQDEADGGLDLSRRDGGLLVVGSKLGSLSGDSLKDVCTGGGYQYMARKMRAPRGENGSSPLTKEFRMDMARLEIPVSGWTCLRTL